MTATKPGFAIGAVGHGVRYLRVTRSSQLYRGIKPDHGVVLTYSGRSEWWIDGRTGVQWSGALQLREPGQVQKDLRRESPLSFQQLSFDPQLIHAACDALGARSDSRLATIELATEDPRARGLVRLHALVREEPDAFVLETAVAEAVGELVSQMEDARTAGAPRLRFHVRRARQFLLDHLLEPVTLDAVADHARIDKFHLSRAFTAEIGLPPYAFLIHARIVRARGLLRRGARPSELAPALGFCDQSQFHRHFVRIVGVTPGSYGRAC